MGKSNVTYNGVLFPPLGTKISVSEQYIYDDSERTVKATQFRVRVQTIIVATGDAFPADLTSSEYNAGPEMHRIRQLISKPGGSLIIDHDGFASKIEINTPGSPVRDISWGPKPRTLVWEPVGNTASVEVVWECEFEIPICDGGYPPQFHGVAQFNYGVSFSIDNKGYTTRTIAGVIEIAMTRLNQRNRNLVDTVDAYRDRIIFGKPPNFERNVEWMVSSDKRTANFSIVDREIQSPNAYPAGVVAISASHRVGVRRSEMTQISNVLSASIELAPTEHKSRAWMIFRAMLENRKSATTETVFLERLEVLEDIYENRVSFEAVYWFTEAASINAMLSQTGIFTPMKLSNGQDAWAEWSESMMIPLIGAGEDRGVAHLEHEWYAESIVDLCEYPRVGGAKYPSPAPVEAIPLGPFCNQRPRPEASWGYWDAKFEYREKPRTTVSVQLQPNDLRYLDFSPSATTTSMPQVSSGEKAKRYVEDKAGSQILIYTGYAERVGYPIPRPGNITVEGKRYKPVGAGVFETKFQGVFFCQPKYAAAWKQQYILAEPMGDFDPVDTLQEVQ